MLSNLAHADILLQEGLSYLTFYQKQMIVRQNYFFKKLIYHVSKEILVHRKTAVDREPGDLGALRTLLHLFNLVFSLKTRVAGLKVFSSFLL